MATDDEPGGDLTEAEIEALHEVELATEWLQRAHGKLVEFHHNTGHAMEHLADAEERLREAGRTDLADEIRDRHLPRGVVDEDRWSYDVLESFEAELLPAMTDLQGRAREEVGDGHSHVAERRQEREWKRRAREE